MVTRQGQGCCLCALLLRSSLALSTPAVVLAAADDDLHGVAFDLFEVAQVGPINRGISRDSKHDLVAFPQAGHGEVLRGGVDELADLRRPDTMPSINITLLCT